MCLNINIFSCGLFYQYNYCQYLVGQNNINIVNFGIFFNGKYIFIGNTSFIEINGFPSVPP